jgi:antirestriction protein ArdC
MAGNKVTNILIDRIIKVAQQEDKLPWERPWEYANAFNYITLHEYRGINRWLVPSGEYLTKKQINEYNKKNGTNYRFAKGIKWEFVLFCKVDQKILSKAEAPEELYDKAMSCSGENYEFIGFHGGYTWFANSTTCAKKRVVRTYHKVAERQFFVDEDGNTLPSRIATGEVVLVKQKPDVVLNNYLDREAIRLSHRDIGRAYYTPALDSINLPPVEHFKSEEDYYATAFHEAGHSTGHFSRLNRKGIEGHNPFGSKGYSREELVAEFCSALCCAETGISEYRSEHEKLFENHSAYVQSWLRCFEKFKTDKDADDIVYICSDAEKAFQCILSATDNDMLEDLNTGNDGSEPVDSDAEQEE